MLSLFEQYKDKLKERYATAFAIFFLHIVHVPKAQDNAEQNAQLIHEFASETTLDSENYVANLILECGRCFTVENLKEGDYGDDDIHYVIDFDLAFLGADPDAYDVHLKNIRQEYSFLSDAEYNEMRLKILKLFMEIPNVFTTKVMKDRFEKQARENMTREVARLSNL